MEAQIVQFLWDTFIAEGALVIAAVFIVGQLIKTLEIFDKVSNRYISLIAVVIGAAVAVISPDVYPGEDLMTAGIKGASLGLMTTGLYEVLKIFFPKLTCKLEEKTANLDSALSEIVEATEKAGKEDVEDSKTSDRPIEELVDEVADALMEADPELTESVKELIEEKLAEKAEENKEQE